MHEPSGTYDCADAERDITSLAERGLSERDELYLAEHLAGCAPCRDTAVAVALADVDPAIWRAIEGVDAGRAVLEEARAQSGQHGASMLDRGPVPIAICDESSDFSQEFEPQTTQH